MRPAARVVAAAEIGELDAPGRGDEHVAGVPARERPSRATLPAVGVGTEPELAAVPQATAAPSSMNSAMSTASSRASRSATLRGLSV